MTPAEILRTAADIIENGYWYRGLGPNGDLPSVWVGKTNTMNRPFTQECACLVSSVYKAGKKGTPNTKLALLALARHLCIPDNVADRNHAMIHVNDSQPLETGRQWAINTLRAAADGVR